MINPSNILCHELIGSKIQITDSSQESVINMSGLIVYETKNMLHIKTDNGLKKIAKNCIKLSQVFLTSSVCFINGHSLIGRPEDRLLKLKR